MTPVEVEVLFTRLHVAALAVIGSLPLAVAVAFALSRPRLPGKLALDGLVHLPVILPPVLVGFLRGSSMNVYAGEDRIALRTAAAQA